MQIFHFVGCHRSAGNFFNDFQERQLEDVRGQMSVREDSERTFHEKFTGTLCVLVFVLKNKTVFSMVTLSVQLYCCIG